MPIAVFAGPSLPFADRIDGEDIVYLPPAARHDVLAAAQTYDAVVLIDGVFHHDLAPSPKECYAALEHARMFGAASMGALRSAECAPYGFTPLGAIARWYACGAIDGDDEVAVSTNPLTHEALSVPLVNVRHVARLARRRGILTAAQAIALVESARAIFYMDRTWDDVLARLPEDARLAVASIAGEEGDLKRLDARFALRTAIRSMSRGNARPLPRQSAPRNPVSPSPRDTSPIVLPQAVPKVPNTYDRAVRFAQTLEVLPALRDRYGITRVADTTRLDRIGIPTFSAFVPQSPDLLGVYNGKGLTPEAATASAVMEATERQVGAAIGLRTFQESLRVVGERIDLEALNLRAQARDLVVDCVLGTDLLRGDAIPVPLAMVQCPWFGEKLFDQTTTNGLASGNNLTEAIYHALCELVERHVWSLYHVRCSVAPRFFGGPQARDVVLAPEIVLPSGDSVVDDLVERIRAAGLHVRVLALPEGHLPFTATAAITETDASLPMAHMGLGCSLSPAHAIVRALTEAVQSRAVDIQAAREDILRVDETAGVMGDHARRLRAIPSEQWYYDLPATRVTFDSFEDRSTNDLAVDVTRTLDALRRDGVDSAIAVDISPSDLPVAVVRAIVPQLETLVFSGHFGAKARALLNPFARAAS